MYGWGSPGCWARRGQYRRGRRQKAVAGFGRVLGQCVFMEVLPKVQAPMVGMMAAPLVATNDPPMGVRLCRGPPDFLLPLGAKPSSPLATTSPSPASTLRPHPNAHAP
jgi:hypothetical protein